MISRQQTKDVLAASLIELSQKESIDKITIQEICENCGIGRTTFYYHFRDKYDLIAWIYEGSIRSIMAAFSRRDDTVELLIRYIDEFQRNSDYYVNALKNTKDDDFFIRTMYDITSNVIDEKIEGRGIKLEESLRFAISFDIRLTIWAIIDWSLSGKPCSAKELAQLICESFAKDVKSFLSDD